jgi:8-oxo-dGTP pyrophosphatase MutT (NUDIX family)
MKIFLNDRTISFLSKFPENSLPSDLIVYYESTEKLKEAWDDFERYEKFKHFKIVNTGSVNPDHTQEMNNGGAAFEAFVSIFKVIHAAGGLVKNEKGEFLFIHRLGHWDLPKGKINKKDFRDQENGTPDLVAATAAAVREVREETGLKSVSVVRQLPDTWHIYPLKEKWILKKTWWFEMTSSSDQTLKPQTSEGIFLVKWTQPGAIHCILSHTYSSIRELLLKTVF